MSAAGLLANLMVLLSQFGTRASASGGDLDGYSIGDLDDLVVLLVNFGVECW